MKKVAIILFCFIGLICKAQNPNFEWAKSLISAGDVRSYEVAKDFQGNVITLGTFDNSTDFDPGSGTYTLPCLGGTDVFISKLDLSGNFLWAKSIGGLSYDDARSMDIDATGNIYITGKFSGSVDFDPSPSTYTLTSGIQDDVFILKLDNMGNFIWVKQLEGDGYQSMGKLRLDVLGNIYLTGGFLDVIDFDPGIGTFTINAGSGASADAFVVKLNPAGNFSWAKNMGSNLTAFALGKSLDIDSSGNVYSIGIFGGSSTTDFDPGLGTYTLNSNTSADDVYISKLDLNGNFLWANKVGGINDDEAIEIRVDNNSNVVVNGAFYDVVDFDPSVSTSYTLASAGESDLFILKLSGAGNFLWANKVGGSDWDYARGVDLDTLGNIYFVGNFRSTFVDLDPGPSVSNFTLIGSSDIFFTKLNGSGNFVWAIQLGGTYGSNSIEDVFVDPTGNDIFSTGNFGNNCDFDHTNATYTLNYIGSLNAFIHKISQCIPLFASNTTSSSNQLICTGNTTTLTASAPSGTLKWYATPSSTTTLSTGTVFVTPTLSTGTYTYYVEVETCTTSISRTPITVTVSACTGINGLTINESKFNLYPNPAANTITIESVQTAEFSIVIMEGKAIEQYSVEGSKTVDLSGFAPGVYFIRNIATGQTKKLIVIKE